MASVFEIPDFVGVLIGNRTSDSAALIAGTIVYEEKFPMLIGLCKNAVDRFPDEPRFVQKNHNHSNQVFTSHIYSATMESRP